MKTSGTQPPSDARAMRYGDEFPPPLERGVYRSRVRSRDGDPVMFAVDSTGRLAGQVVVDRLTTPEKAERLLWAQLDECDAQPHAEPWAIPDLYLC